MIGKEAQLLVVIPCDFVHHGAPSEDGWSHSRRFADHQSTTGNLTETDLEAAQQLLQLSSQSFESTAGVEDGEDASSCLPKQKFARFEDFASDDAAVTSNGKKSASKVGGDGGLARRVFKARDTSDGLDGGARRRYKRISHIYDVTSPKSLCADGRSRRSVKRRKIVAFF